MKKGIAILLTVLLAVSLIACGKGNSIVGTWTLDSGVGEDAEQAVAMMKAFGMTMSITFNADGTGTMDSAFGEQTESIPFNYTYENGVLTMEGGEAVQLQIEGDKLVLDQDGSQMIFKKN